MKEARAQREAAEAAAQVAAEAAAEQNRRAVAAAQASMGLAGMYGAAMMVQPGVNPYVASFGRMYGMGGQVAPPPVPGGWAPQSPFTTGAHHVPISPGYTGTSPGVTVAGHGAYGVHSSSAAATPQASRWRAIQIESDHNAFDTGAFPVPPDFDIQSPMRGGLSAGPIAATPPMPGPSGPAPAFTPRSPGRWR